MRSRLSLGWYKSIADKQHFATTARAKKDEKWLKRHLAIAFTGLAAITRPMLAATGTVF
ncbi:hypothetical protein AAH678_02795 [Sodalis endosymbiont of Spalangia cameroni]|uniref:hypothetical protein n=1 Tax=Sodalis praecaptivus TaxID=1239307 RepID=UPI0031F871AF